MSDTVKKPRTPKKPKTTKVQKMDISKKDPDIFLCSDCGISDLSGLFRKDPTRLCGFFFY